MWEIKLLGAPRVVGFGRTITRFESRRALALLAYLALHPGGPHPRELLVDRIWPDATPEAGRNRLKQALSTLRRQLEPLGTVPGSVIEADRHSAGLRPGSFRCDAVDLLQALRDGDLELAQSLGGGEFMPAFYDDWLDPFRYEIEAANLVPRLAPVHDVQASFERRLPISATSFVGREEEVELVLSRLATHRWITITGMGGIGKSRLGLAVAERWSGPAVFVPLAAIAEPTGLMGAVLGAFGIDPMNQTNPEQVVLDLLRPETLLVLDNLEHLRSPDVQARLENWLEKTEVRLLISSRVAVGSAQEMQFPLSHLPVPGSVKDLASNPSARLFLERAQLSRPDFQLSERNQAELFDLLVQLEGIPLAIELCAAWSHVGLARIAAKLGTASLTEFENRRAQNDRHRSLGQVFESTLDLYPLEVQGLFRELTIFRAPFEWEVASSIASNPDLENLSVLIQGGLVRPDYQSDPPRFTILESLRRHVGDVDNDVSTRFVTEYLRIVASAKAVAPEPDLNLVTQRDYIDFFAAEWPNFLAAASLLGLEDRHSFVSVTEWFWSIYGLESTVVDWIQAGNSDRMALLRLSYLPFSGPEEERELAIREFLSSPVTGIRAEAALRLAKRCILRQKMDDVDALGEIAERGFEEIGDLSGVAQALHIRANAMLQLGEFARAEAMLLRSEELFAECRSDIHLAAVLYTRARSFYVQKLYAEALPSLYRCRDAAKRLNYSRFLSRAANLFAVVLRHLGEESRARVYLLLALRANQLTREIRGSHIPLWNLYLSLGAEERFHDAAYAFGAAMEIWDVYFQLPQDPHNQGLVDDFRARSILALGDSEFTAREHAGRSASFDDVLNQTEAILADEIQLHREDFSGFF